MLRRRSTKIAIACIAVVAVVVTWRAVSAPEPASPLTVAEFRAELANRRIVTADVARTAHAIHGTLDDGSKFRVEYPVSSERSLTSAMDSAGVEYTVSSPHSSTWTAIAIEVVPMLIVFAMLGFFLRRIGGRFGGGFGRSKAKAFEEDQPDVTFADVAGVDEVVEELAEIKAFLVDPKRFDRVGARVPKGVLLCGPPGTGKTLLARSVAGEARVPFFSVSGSDFVELFVGVGAARVRDLFAQAKAAAPSIVFIDEIDAVGRHRGAGLGGGHDEREQTLNQLLVEMDGFATNTGVVVMAATNRPDILDPALLRPGRFDRQVTVDRPDLRGRIRILEVHAAGKPIADGVDLATVARRTVGFTGADLANVVNEAALLTARHGFDQIGTVQFDAAVERVMTGPQRTTRCISDTERQLIAYHEAGHALVAHVLPNADAVHKVSIIPRGAALGFTLTLPEEDRFVIRRSELQDQIAMLLGGRAAELLVFGDPTTGAQNDIERATMVAHQMVADFGMTERLGPVRLGSGSTEVFLGRDLTTTPQYSQEIAAEIDAEVRSIVDTAHDRATAILVDHRIVLDELAAALLDDETIEGSQLDAILSRARREDDTIVLPGASPAGAVAASTLPPTNRSLP